MTKSHANESIFTMSIPELQARVAKVAAHYAAISELLPGLLTLTDDDRRHSDGKLRDGETDALDAILDVAEAHPTYFTSLADKDEGVDPSIFETELLRNHLERRAILAALAETAEQHAAPLDDTVLALGERTRPVLLAAYQIAKSVAATDANVRARLSPAIDFYGRIARRAAETRHARKSAAPAEPESTSVSK